jgi:hypothetical protein
MVVVNDPVSRIRPRVWVKLRRWNWAYGFVYERRTIIQVIRHRDTGIVDQDVEESTLSTLHSASSALRIKWRGG